MTIAEKLMKTKLSIPLNCKRDGEFHEEYTAEFKPDCINPLQLMSNNYDEEDPMGGDAIYLSYESAVELALFLKRLFIDEAP